MLAQRNRATEHKVMHVRMHLLVTNVIFNALCCRIADETQIDRARVGFNISYEKKHEDDGY